MMCICCCSKLRVINLIYSKGGGLCFHLKRLKRTSNAKPATLLEKAIADLESIRAKKVDILEKEKQGIARVNSLESTRILQLVNLSKIDSSQLKALLMAEQPKPVEQVVTPETTNFVTERITEDEEDE